MKVTVSKPTMRVLFFAVLLAVGSARAEEITSNATPETATHLIANVFDECLQHGLVTSCITPKILRFLRSVLDKDEIQLTENLSIIKSKSDGEFKRNEQNFESTELPEEKSDREQALRYIMLERIDNFLDSHRLKVKVPREITSGEILSFAPAPLTENIPNQLIVPLSETTSHVQGRGFMKKVMIPFLLGLKFKATLFIPLAIALIALKTWKALTLGLLSLVLSGAMVIFKFTKPKVVNYEVYHYPSHHSAGPIVDHSSPYGSEHHGYGRSHETGQKLAYRAYAD